MNKKITQDKAGDIVVTRPVSENVVLQQTYDRVGALIVIEPKSLRPLIRLLRSCLPQERRGRRVWTCCDCGARGYVQDKLDDIARMEERALKRHLQSFPDGRCPDASGTAVIRVD